MATYVIGDIQGCFASFMRLLDVCGWSAEHDHLWLCGDLINRGPQSYEVLAFVRSLNERVTVVLGNHDVAFLAYPVMRAQGMRPQPDLEALLEHPDAAALIDWLRQQPFLHHTATHTLVHAGVWPWWDRATLLAQAKALEACLQAPNWTELWPHLLGHTPLVWSSDLDAWAQRRFALNVFTRMRYLRGTALDLTTQGPPDKAPEGCLPWFDALPKHTGHTICFGHWSALRGHTGRDDCLALDTGCVWGETLTAYRLEDGRSFSVPCPTQNRSALLTPT